MSLAYDLGSLAPPSARCIGAQQLRHSDGSLDWDSNRFHPIPRCLHLFNPVYRYFTSILGAAVVSGCSHSSQDTDPPKRVTPRDAKASICWAKQRSSCFCWDFQFQKHWLKLSGNGDWSCRMSPLKVFERSCPEAQNRFRIVGPLGTSAVGDVSNYQENLCGWNQSYILQHENQHQSEGLQKAANDDRWWWLYVTSQTAEPGIQVPRAKVPVPLVMVQEAGHKNLSYCARVMQLLGMSLNLY